MLHPKKREENKKRDVAEDCTRKMNYYDGDGDDGDDDEDDDEGDDGHDHDDHDDDDNYNIFLR